jgi:hypothetical protein
VSAILRPALLRVNDSSIIAFGPLSLFPCRLRGYAGIAVVFILFGVFQVFNFCVVAVAVVAFFVFVRLIFASLCYVAGGCICFVAGGGEGEAFGYGAPRDDSKRDSRPAIVYSRGGKSIGRRKNFL